MKIGPYGTNEDAAVEAGADPVALVASINAAQQEWVAAQAELTNAPVRD